MRLLRPIPARIARAVSLLVVLSWMVTMGVVLTRAFAQSRSLNLATDLARYGTSAQWRGVYYRGEKVGFTVSQTLPTDDGFQVQEDARLQMSLLGATSAAAIRTTAQVDNEFVLRSFDFSLDPGTGPVQVTGHVAGRHVSLTIKTASGTQTDERDLDEPPVLSVNLPRMLAARGFKPGTQEQFFVFDPATLRTEKVTLSIGKRELVNINSLVPTRVGSSIPAFRVDLAIAGIPTSSWITDTGNVVREESPLGLMSVQEPPEVARRMAISRGITGDLLEASAVVPRNTTKQQIDDPRDVRRILLKIEGADLASPDLQGAGQSLQGDLLEVRDARALRAAPTNVDLAAFVKPEPLIESDDPEIRREADAAVLGATDPRAMAERLTRRVNGMLDKKPTVSLPSAREVLRTKIGDCNEHTALYVAMARSLGLPARIAVGLVYTRGAFFYHAWPEVYIDEARDLPRARGSESRGYWLPVDPTFNQFPADATHVRLARGGLDKQAAILPMIGKIKMTIVELELTPNSAPVLIGRGSTPSAPFASPVPVRTGLTCWSSPVSRR